MNFSSILFALCVFVNVPSGICSKATTRKTVKAPTPVPKITDEEAMYAYWNSFKHLKELNLQQKFLLGEAVYNYTKSSIDRKRREAQGGTDPVPLEDMAMVHQKVKTLWPPIIKNGIDSTFKQVATQSHAVRELLLLIAISYENAQLVEQMLSKNTPSKEYFPVSVLTYRRALDKLSSKSTENTDRIIELIYEANPKFKTLNASPSNPSRIDTGFALTKVIDYVLDKDFPSFKQALNEGLNPNTKIPFYGSFLTLSVIASCTKCAEVLIDRGAEVNELISYKYPIKVKAMKDPIKIFNYTPLMFAVADGQTRMIDLLIKSGRARVSLGIETQNGITLHARQVARNIADDEFRKHILGKLRLCDSEKQELSEIVRDKNFIAELKKGDLSVIDAFLLLRPHTNVVPESFKVNLTSLGVIIERILRDESINIINE